MPEYRVVTYYDWASGFGPYYAVVSRDDYVPAPGADGKIRHWFPVKRDTHKAALALCDRLA